MLEALKKAEEEGSTINYWAEANPRCPHCGETYDISKHEAWKLYGNDGDENSVACGSCDKDFEVVTQVIYSFRTDEQPDDDL